MTRDFLDIRPEVAAALDEGRAVVALETTAIAQGLPRPRNLETALRLDDVVRQAGAVPAWVAVLEGRARVGLEVGELEVLATRDDVAKVSARDLGPALVSGRPGATTVAGTLRAAHMAGIRVFATGGIGGVHRGAEVSFDVSADLGVLARTPVALVSSGIKLILDLSKSLEAFETQSVPVVGYGCSEFPAFVCRGSGLDLPARVEGPAGAADLMRAHWALCPEGGLLFANPVPAESALPRKAVEAWIATALEEMDAAGIAGKDVTPFLLDRLAVLSGGRTLEANIALLEDNARVAARIARAYARR